MEETGNTYKLFTGKHQGRRWTWEHMA